MIKDISNKIIYHGSYLEVSKPDLRRCMPGKDFGVGFYTTTDRNQAIKFAKRTARIYKRSYGILNLYKLSNFDGLSVHEFSSTDIDWLMCIIGFRYKKLSSLSNKYSGFDVIIGKVADDDTSRTINAYMAGAFGPLNNMESAKRAISLLMPDKLKNQITFKTDKSLKKIKFMRSEQIWL